MYLIIHLVLSEVILGEGCCRASEEHCECWGLCVMLSAGLPCVQCMS